MVRNELIRRYVALALMGATSTALAQTAPAPEKSSDELQEIVVTGTLIKRTDAETAEAITILKADNLKDMGIQNVEQALAMLTSNTPAINIASAVGTFSGGGTYANLRNLGQGRTLVLLDGQRLANNANSGNAVDLSGIPFSAIDQIQVLREGAAALYGADAVAGVVNFITKKNWQGLELEGNFDKTQHGGGNSDQFELTAGHGDVKSDGYNVMFTASYTRQNELQAPQRGFSSPGFDPAGGYSSTNNPGSWPGTFVDANGNSWQANYPACTGNPYLTTYFGNCAYRYSTATDLLPESHEASALLAITKSLPSNNELKLQYFYTRSELTAFSGPMFYFFQMNPNSPYYPTASTPLTCVGTCSAPVDLGPGGDAVWTDPNNDRYTGNINSEQRVLLSFTGSNGGWDYNAYGNWSQNKNMNLNEAGYPVEFPVAGYNGNVLAPGGVLSNLINPFGAQSAAGQAYINSTYADGSYAEGKEKRWSIDLNASHELGDIFDSGTPSSIALGASTTNERFTYGTTPYNNLVQAATGLSASQVEGSRTSQAAFAILDLPFTKALDLELQDREDHYSDFGNTNNWKAKVTYKPASILELRGTASTGFRAPTLYSLYSPNFIAASSSGTMGAGNPDCANATATPPSAIAPFTPATCITQGLAVYGGNPNLTPEKSQNYDFGFVLSPTDDLGITVDYFRVIVKNTIGSVPVTAIYGSPTTFASYYVLSNTGGLTPSIQSAVDCTPYTSATCGYIKQTNQNTGYQSTDGIDISVQYAQHTSIGTFHEDLEGTAVTQFLVQQYTGGPLLNLVGEFNQLLPAYRWSHNLRLDWTSPEKMWSAGLDNRFYSEYIDEFPDGNGNQRHVASYSLVDGYVGMKPTENLSLLFGIKNIGDHNPPFTNAYQNNFSAGYNSLIADPLLRNFYINVKYTF